MYVKICGLTHPADVEAAIAAGADLLGFVLCASPRQVFDPAPLLEAAAGVETVAVFRTWSGQDVSRFDRVQAFRFEGTPPAAMLPAYRDAPGLVPPDGEWLLDSASGGGSGQRVPTERARELARHGRAWLAGGLTPDNVAQAVRTIRPVGVDVSSGVEAYPGRKDPAAIIAFVNAARAAAAELQETS